MTRAQVLKPVWSSEYFLNILLLFFFTHFISSVFLQVAVVYQRFLQARRMFPAISTFPTQLLTAMALTGNFFYLL